MPSVACPECGKTYKVAASAAGKKATCKACGRVFRVGAKKKKQASPPPLPRRQTVPPDVPTSGVETGQDDADFWNDEIGGDLKLAADSAPVSASRSEASKALAAAEAEVQASKKKKVRWGFQWEKVFGGGAAFVLAGGATVVLVLATGRLFIYLAGIAIAGLFTMLSGLMGEEGIWGKDD